MLQKVSNPGPFISFTGANWSKYFLNFPLQKCLSLGPHPVCPPNQISQVSLVRLPDIFHPYTLSNPLANIVLPPVLATLLVQEVRTFPTYPASRRPPSRIKVSYIYPNTPGLDQETPIHHPVPPMTPRDFIPPKPFPFSKPNLPIYCLFCPS